MAIFQLKQKAFEQLTQLQILLPHFFSTQREQLRHGSAMTIHLDSVVTAASHKKLRIL
jgi:hypothetical protein